MILSSHTSSKWCSPGDLDKDELESFQLCCHDHNLRPGLPAPPPRGDMIRILRSEMARIGAFLSMFLVIFLLDETGMIMDMFSVIGEFQEGLDLPGLELGMNLSKYFFGMNAISLAMDMGCVGIVRGFEHTVPIFQRWNSVCSPIFAAGSVQGYLSISVPVERQVEFAVPFLQQLSAKLAACRETEGKDHAEEFQQYNLSPRECEVALAWFLRKSALYISNELGIKEGTVRNIVKNIYSKMNVSDRSQFIKKLTH